jgi:hypothetical protein
VTQGNQAAPKSLESSAPRQVPDLPGPALGAKVNTRTPGGHLQEPGHTDSQPKMDLRSVLPGGAEGWWREAQSHWLAHPVPVGLGGGYESDSSPWGLAASASCKRHHLL